LDAVEVGDTTDSPILTERFDQALAYALHVHRCDLRKSTAVPYAGHLLGVCSIVLENGGNEDEAIAALLHDAAEDHGGHEQLEAIAARFGPEVTQIVAECSDALVEEGADKGEWLARKQWYIARLRSIGAVRPGTMLVSAADKLYNLRSIHADLRRPEVGDAVFKRFSGSKWGTLWYYRTLADLYSGFAGRHASIATNLAELIGEMGGGRSSDELLALHEASRASTPG
jgi:(p)ppGpp synthase/HD superfamily hydrolase